MSLYYFAQQLHMRPFKATKFIIAILFIGCQSKQQTTDEDKRIEVPMDTLAQTIPANDAYAKQETNYDYRQLYGIYDHESTTSGFSAVVTLNPYGNDLLFTASVSQGDCKGESEGAISIMDHNEKYYTGFYESEDCRMQFSFIYPENKIDIKEITLCSHHGSSCSFEGTYIKRKN